MLESPLRTALHEHCAEALNYIESDMKCSGNHLAQECNRIVYLLRNDVSLVIVQANSA